MRVFESALTLAGGLFACRTASAFVAPAASIRALRNAPAGGASTTSTYGSSRGAPATRMMAAEGVTFGELDGTDVRVGIISTRWNEEIVNRLTDGVKESLKECNVTESNIFETKVPGAFELPLAARFLSLSQTVDAVVCVGCLIKGDTMHFEYIAESTCKGLMDVSIQTSTPVVLGVLTCTEEEQAIKRSTGDNNHGVDWGKTAVEMGLLRMSATGVGKKAGGALGFGKSLDDKKDGKDGAIPGSKPKKIGF
ncbi:6,7-dimethyl-8-ribityllumazine synthase [Ectocarpus siliculosus]|uniref:6,7-dimethyl-8-ribityllumazine synthase n=1 Tax=Ectocarpus siliculosus TaxID=2880 RepID=D8LLC7_ECTSI|nr:6,7-dimethyl-8-ribityllumazine synthase [Ectocarpus siliculosus]|eukprot:CBN77125.1 6,7-dimethyl-8-ribityllumazine synthase [Ectocarpus siliculosus]